MMIVAGYGDVYISHISDVRLDYKLSDQDSYKHLSKHYTRCTGPIKIEERKGNKKSQLSLTEMGTVHGPQSEPASASHLIDICWVIGHVIVVSQCPTNRLMMLRSATSGQHGLNIIDVFIDTEK